MTNNDEMNRLIRRRPADEPAPEPDHDDVEEVVVDMNDLLARRTDTGDRRRANHVRLFGDPDHNPAA